MENKPFRQLLALVVLFCAVVTGTAFSAETPLETSKATWDKSVTLRTAIGYKDNVLLNKSNKQSSGFWQNSADFFVFGDQSYGNHFTFFASFEDRRYFSAEGINKEQIGTSQADFKRDVGEDWQLGTLLQYVYLDQVIDISITETVSQSLPVRAHALSGAPYVVRQLPLEMRLEGRFDIERQFVREPLDDFWEGGPRLTLYKKYRNRSELFVGYAYHHRAYDTRRQFDLTYTSLPDTSLRFDKHMVETGVKHYWDEARRWRTTIKGIYERNQDNGPGFYHFHKYKAAIQGAYVREDWEAKLQGRFTHYDFDRQPVDFGNNTPLARFEWNVNAQVRKTLWKTLAAFLESDHEWVESNYSIDSYGANTVMGGIDFEF